jgi:hypothetical protein
MQEQPFYLCLGDQRDTEIEPALFYSMSYSGCTGILLRRISCHRFLFFVATLFQALVIHIMISPNENESLGWRISDLTFFGLGMICGMGKKDWLGLIAALPIKRAPFVFLASLSNCYGRITLHPVHCSRSPACDPIQVSRAAGKQMYVHSLCD